jgi:hypothetical protein
MGSECIASRVVHSTGAVLCHATDYLYNLSV